MNKITDEKTTAAFAAGYAAAKNNKARVPALCPAYLGLIVGLQVGEGGADLARQWFKGYQVRCDEEAEAVLALSIVEEYQEKMSRRELLRRELAACHRAQPHLSGLSVRHNKRRIKERQEELETIEADLARFDHFGASDICRCRRLAGDNETRHFSNESCG